MCWSELSVRANSGICKISLVVGIGLPTCVLQTYGIFFFFSVGMVIKLAWGCRGSKKTADSTAAGRGEKFSNEYYRATNLSAHSGNWVLKV